MKNIWKNHKLVVILAAYVTIAAALVRFLVVPLVGEIQNKSDDIQEKIIDSQINQSRLSKIPQMEADYGVFQEKKEALNVILDANDEVGFIKELEAMAQETGNTITLQVDNSDSNNQKATTTAEKHNLSIKDKLSYSNYISMQVSLEGNYAGLVNFIYKLENDSYYVNIISMDLSKVTQTEENSTPIQQQPSQAGVFSSNSNNSNSPFSPSTQAQTITKEKDVLKSTLSVVVYIKQ